MVLVSKGVRVGLFFSAWRLTARSTRGGAGPPSPGHMTRRSPGRSPFSPTRQRGSCNIAIEPCPLILLYSRPGNGSAFYQVSNGACQGSLLRDVGRRDPPGSCRPFLFGGGATIMVEAGVQNWHSHWGHHWHRNIVDSQNMTALQPHGGLRLRSPSK